jgi:polar amino acid transport system ATP-binding protein
VELRLKDIKKSYEHPVLHGIDLELSGYKSIGIIGKSGCGKSTLLRLLAGIELPDTGEISINKRPVDKKNLREYQNEIGMVFQNHNLFPHLSLLKNITLILEKTKGYENEEAEEIGRNLLKQLHLENEMYKKPSKVSGGQAQRAAIARAMSTNPKLIFMDEPTAALDPILTKEVLEAVISLRKSGRHFIFVTHEINFVKKFADYVIFMNDGKIHEKGKVDILTNPNTVELKKFLEHE